MNYAVFALSLTGDAARVLLLPDEVVHEVVSEVKGEILADIVAPMHQLLVELLVFRGNRLVLSRHGRLSVPADSLDQSMNWIRAWKNCVVPFLPNRSSTP